VVGYEKVLGLIDLWKFLEEVFVALDWFGFSFVLVFEVLTLLIEGVSDIDICDYISLHLIMTFS